MHFQNQPSKTSYPGNYISVALGECEIEGSHVANSIDVTIDSHLKWDERIYIS